jgi:cellobiose phosphorylase
MLYGFLGFRPRLDGCVLAPHLPRDWPSLTVRNIRLHDVDLDVTALPGRVKLSVRGQPSRPLKVFTSRGDGPQADIREGEIEVVLPN